MARKQSNQEDVVIYCAGDVIVRIHPKDFKSKSQFDLILPTLREADIRYCQLEQLFSDRPHPTRIVRPNYCAAPERVEELKYAGFDVISPNGNHAWDFGNDALSDTIDMLPKHGFKTIGVGKTIHDARRPAVFEKKGNKIAFLAYNSILPADRGAEMWVAKETFRGLAPMRALTFYDKIEIEQPGTPPRTYTFPNREDLKALKNDVEKAKASADVVVVALHFGIHRVRAALADYQQDVAHAAIDAGADVIIGTHPHIQKAIEVYKGKVIFYALANFSFDKSVPAVKSQSHELKEVFKEREALWGTYNDNKKKPTDELESSIAKIVVSDKKIKQVSFIPLLVNKYDEPYRPMPGSRGFKQSVQYTLDVTKEAGIDTKFKVEGGEVIVVP
jgi:poly-gamma-glutamate capsule biosynthesis protein CapA/YwtB (metallophosphatase superfamily)